jgi:hypothetical protein
MQIHPSDDDLILHAYGDCRPDVAREIDGHLHQCAQCAAVWTELRQTLQLVDAADVAEPDAGFERIMWARVQQELFSRPPRWSARQWLPLAGLATAALVAMAVVTTHVDRGSGSSAGVRAGVDARGPERVLLTALDGHLEQTELLLIELMNAPDDTDEIELAFERGAAENLLSSGRLYRVTAHHQGDLRLARVLEDIEPVLVDLARSADHVDRGSLQSLQGRIEDQALLFKVRTAVNEVRERQQVLITP